MAVGCGGGKNLQRILNHSKSINAIGIDISPTSVKTSVRKNRRAIKSGRLQVVQGSVEALPFASNLFDLVTAVESVHYWEIEKDLSEVYRTLKKGGQLLIVNETQSSDGLDEYLAEVGFKVYTAKQLENFLKQTGFKKIRTDVNENGKWIAVVAEK
ncbi:MAG: class I SAM-dependent methyltransferase [Clostridia bacterium]|nr:class I SAM-dependent methyltransferase [Clostridia bacterium]